MKSFAAALFAALAGLAFAAAPAAAAAAQNPAPARPASVEQAPARAPASVVFRNDLPGTYELRRVRFWVDGVLAYDGPRPFRMQVAPGRHVVSIAADYRMHDPLLPYVGGYAFELRSADRVDGTTEGPVVARAVEVGGVTTPVDRRAQIVWGVSR